MNLCVFYRDCGRPCLGFRAERFDVRRQKSHQHGLRLCGGRKRRRFRRDAQGVATDTRRLTLERLEYRHLLDAAPVLPQVIYHEDFESGDGGYLADNIGGTQLGLWHYSVGRRDDQLTNHTPDHSWYYGAFRDGDRRRAIQPSC